MFFGATAAVATAATFAVLSAGHPVQGVFANAEHFVVLPVVAGAILLHFALGKTKALYLFLAGLCFGLGFVIKQHGAVFIAWAALIVAADWLFIDSDKKVKQLWARIGLFSLGASFPYLLTCLLMFKAGVFEKFWFWTFDYARAYTAQVSLIQAWDALSLRAARILVVSPILWGLAALGVPLIASCKNRRSAIFVGSFAVFSFLAIFPGGFFRPHYFVLLLPASALLVGTTVDYLGKLPFSDKKYFLKKGMPIALIVAGLLSSLYLQRHFLFQMTPAQVAIYTYGTNPFNQSLEIAKFIKRDSQPEDRIAIIGSEPQIYFYTGLHSATGYIYMYPLMEKHDFALTMQQELIKEVEAAGPKYLIFVHIRASWLQKPASHRLIYDWFEKYVKNYERVGMVKIFDHDTRYSWDPDVAWSPETSHWLEILKRKDLGN